MEVSCLLPRDRAPLKNNPLARTCCDSAVYFMQMRYMFGMIHDYDY